MTEPVIRAIVGAMQTQTPGQARTAKATRAAQLAAQNKRAQYLRDRGWTCTPPPDAGGEQDRQNAAKQ